MVEVLEWDWVGTGLREAHGIGRKQMLSILEPHLPPHFSQDQFNLVAPAARMSRVSRHSAR